jgi:hypothetical protein
MTTGRTPASARLASARKALYDSDSSDDDSGFSCGQYSVTKRPMSATPSGGVVTSSTPLSATAQRRRSQLALAKSAREASREKETLQQRCEHLETHIETLREDASTGAEMRTLTSDLESEIRRLELEHERAAENDEWLRRALQEKASTVAAMERERGTLAARVAELEDPFGGVEVCPRDAEAQRDKMARRCKRVQAGRLAAEATAAALTGEVSRLHAALERITNGGDVETNAASSTVLRHGKVTVECVRSPYASGVATGLDFDDDLADSDSDLDEDESTTNPPVLKTTPGAALRELSLGDSAMDAGSPSADSNGSVVSKHPNAEASNTNQFEFRVEYTPESKPGKLTHRMFTPSKTDIEVVDALAGFVGDCVSAATVDGELVTFAVLAMRAASSMRSPALKFLYGVAVVGSVLLAMIVTWELVGAATGESPVKGMAIRMGGVPPRVRPSWREGFILV